MKLESHIVYNMVVILSRLCEFGLASHPTSWVASLTLNKGERSNPALAGQDKDVKTAKNSEALRAPLMKRQTE